MKDMRRLFMFGAEAGTVVTAKDGALLLGVSKQRMHSLIAVGRIRAQRIGRNVYVAVPDLKDYCRVRDSGKAVGGRGKKQVPGFLRKLWDKV